MKKKTQYNIRYSVAHQGQSKDIVEKYQNMSWKGKKCYSMMCVNNLHDQNEFIQQRVFVCFFSVK